MPLQGGVIGAPRALDFARQHCQLVALLAQFQHACFLPIERLLQLRDLPARDLRGLQARALCRVQLRLQLRLDRFELGLGAEILGMVLVIAASHLREPPFRANTLRFQTLHEWIAHDVRHLVDALVGRRRGHLLLPRLGFIHRALSRNELAGKLRQARVLDIETIRLGPENPRLLLVRGEALLRTFERSTKLLHLAFEPPRLATRRIDLQLQARLDVAFRESIRQLRSRHRVRGRIVDVDDAALTRGPHIDLSQQLIGEPVTHRADATRRGLELLPYLDELREFQFVHDLQCDVVTPDHVHLCRNVRRQQRRRHQRSGHRVRALRIDDERDGGHIARREHKGDGQSRRYRRHQHAENEPATRAQNAQGLSEFHEARPKRDFP